MTIVLSGGGTGGHIMPLLAVARELRKIDDGLKLVYIGEKNGKFNDVPLTSDVFDECYFVWAGKLRRYHGQSFFSKITDFQTIFLNIKDVFKIITGIVQSYFLLKKINPDAVFLKGGFVCVPVSIGASKTKALIVTHDSDALPGLSNRFAGKYAKYHAVAMPAKYYKYSKDSIKEVGLPVDEKFRVYSEKEIKNFKQELKIPSGKKIIFVTGGSLGGRRLNEWSLDACKQLLSNRSDIFFVISLGKGNLKQLEGADFSSEHKKHIKAFEFTTEIYKYLAVSDLVISRAGATSLVEIATSQKPSIVVPNPLLAGGHQLINAKAYADAGSVVVVQEDELSKSDTILAKKIQEIIDDRKVQKTLTSNIAKTVSSDSPASAIAKLLLNQESK